MLSGKSSIGDTSAWNVEMFQFCIWTKGQWIVSIIQWWSSFCPSSSSGERHTAAAEAGWFESAGQGNFHPKDSQKPALVLIFCKSGNAGGTSRSAFYTPSTSESATEPFQPWLQNSCPNMVAGPHTTPKTPGLWQEFNRPKQVCWLITTTSKQTDDWYWVMHNRRRTSLISVRIGSRK